MLLSGDARRLFVALDNADVVAVIDTERRVVIDEIQTVAPAGMLRLAKRYRGASPNAMALAADEKTLFVTNRGTNSVAVIDIDDAARQVRGLIPTGWYPSDLVVGPAEVLYIVNTRKRSRSEWRQLLGLSDRTLPGQTHARSFRTERIHPRFEQGGAAQSSPAAPRSAADVDSASGRQQSLRKRQSRLASHGGVARENQTRDLHHQGEPHLRSGARGHRARQ